MLNDQYISVTDLNYYIKTYLENNYFLQDIYVKGEISNFKRHQSGTLYFAIKDDKAAVNVVMFASYASKLKTSLKDGDLVLRSTRYQGDIEEDE
jgi:exodeoxyribonuclease VII large subunit